VVEVETLRGQVGELKRQLLNAKNSSAGPAGTHNAVFDSNPHLTLLLDIYILARRSLVFF
jgi:hypothetical protein